MKAQSGEKAPAERARLFQGKEAWAQWLEKNHTIGRLVVAGGEKGIRPEVGFIPRSTEIALCYGWIDGQKKAESDQAWLQRFLPRSEKSIWSKINRQKALL